MAESRSALTQLSDAFADAVEKAARSTVTVKARRRFPASGIIWSDGVVVTSSHVVERDHDIKVVLGEGGEKEATLAGRDPGSDLAVLRVEGAKPAAVRASDGDIKVGHMVLAIGRPGDDPMASSGVVSTVGGPWRSMLGGTQLESYIRADVTFYPGFSGGPLVDGAGQVIGINTSRLGRGAGLTIPAGAADRVVAVLLKSGRIKRGYLGIGNQPVRLPKALAAKLGRQQERGLLIVSVEGGTPADKAGLLVGDIAVALAGQAVEDTDDLQQLLGPERVGKATTISILRGGDLREVKVTVGERS
jgi:S1-C subfamily serine protease